MERLASEDGAFKADFGKNMKYLTVLVLSLLCPGPRLKWPELTGPALEEVLLRLLAEWERKAGLLFSV